MIRAILTDLDGVTRNWNAERFTKAENTTGLPLGSIRQAAFSPDLLLTAMTGQMTHEDWRREIVSRLRVQFPDADSAEAVRLWSVSPGDVNRDVLEVWRACRVKVRILLVTNATSRLPKDLHHLNLIEEFDHIVNSAKARWAKPHAEIFQAALRAAGTSAPETFFVDDTAENVEAASRLGIVTHLFRGGEQLQFDLKRLGF